MKRDYGQYTASYKLDGPVFTAERTMTMRERELPATAYRGLLAFRRAVRPISASTSPSKTPRPAHQRRPRT